MKDPLSIKPAKELQIPKIKDSLKIVGGVVGTIIGLSLVNSALNILKK